MQNKPKSRTDVQWILSSLSLAVTLGLWGLFTSADKKGAGVSGQADLVQPTTEPQQVVITQQPQMLQPGQVLLFNGTAPQQQQTVVRTVGGGGGHRSGGGGGGAVTSTHSSHP